jgi:N-acetylglutamate synthase
VSYRISEITMEDYPEVMALWRATEGIGLSAADEPERIRAYLARNPGLSFVARAEDQVVGAVLCGHDGRRGLLHHLAVRADCRKQGIGKALMERCLAGLSAQGIDKCHLFVFKDNQAGIEFWKSQGWQERVTLVLMSKDLPVHES